MYFNNDKSDTNIDKDFKNKPSLFNFDFGRYLKWIVIGVVVLILLIILIVFLTRRNKYTLTLNGDSVMNIYQGDKYVDPGYVAYDKKRNDVSSSVVVKDDNVDTSTVGEYIVTYSLKNIRKIRKVNVIEKPVEATYLYLKGDTTIRLKLGEKYKEPGWTVTDPYDDNLTDKVKVDSNVDTSKEGTYRIIYSVTNSKGIVTNVTRVIIVSK